MNFRWKFAKDVEQVLADARSEADQILAEAQNRARQTETECQAMKENCMSERHFP